MGAAYSEDDVQIVTQLLDGDLTELLGTSGSVCPKAKCRGAGFRNKCVHCGYENPAHSLYQRMLWYERSCRSLLQPSDVGC